MFGDFYRGRKVLVTGHTGFKGSWLSLWLRELGATVAGFGLGPPTEPSLHALLGDAGEETVADICDSVALDGAIQKFQPDVVFHLAAQAIVRQSYTDPLETLRVNALGTAHLLEALRRAGRPCVVITVTSDKCYENREWEFAYRENDALGGHDVYSMSKAAAELVTASWRHAFFSKGPVRVASARAGNVVGGGDFAADRLIPDCVRSLAESQKIVIRNPHSTRPWQHVLEPLAGYLLLAARLANEGGKLASAFNFGPGPRSNQPVVAVVEKFLESWEGEWMQVQESQPVHEASRLNLAIEKAAAELGWHPVWDFEMTIAQTALWYREWQKAPARAKAVTIRQIDEYVAAARSAGLAWTLEQ